MGEQNKSIRESIDTIRHGIKGKDIRGALADGLETTYDHASVEKDNANMEVKMARGTSSTLGGRLDKADSKQELTNVEVNLARGKEKTLGQRLKNIDAEVSNITSLVSNKMSNSPKGVFETLTSLVESEVANTIQGKKEVYVVEEDGRWYFWNGATWVAGGIYQATVSSEFPATNEVLNGDFSRGAADWLGIYYTLSAKDNILTCEVIGDSVNARIEQRLDTAVAGHIYYMAGEILPKHSTPTHLEIGQSNKSYIRPTPNVWNKISTIETAKNNQRFRFYHRTNGDYAIGDVFKIRNVLSIDLTATFGIGNEPTKREMDDILSNYNNSHFNGTVSPLITTKNVYLDFISFLTEENEEWSVE